MERSGGAALLGAVRAAVVRGQGERTGGAAAPRRRRGGRVLRRGRTVALRRHSAQEPSASYSPKFLRTISSLSPARVGGIGGWVLAHVPPGRDNSLAASLQQDDRPSAAGTPRLGCTWC